MPEVRSVALGFWVGVGSRDEDPALLGVSHFLEHLLFKGTEGRTARQIAEAVDEVGGDLNAFTTKEYTTFEVRVLSEHLGLGLDILSDIVWSPAFRPEEIEAERGVIYEEILMAHDEPADLVHDLFADAAFPHHPLGRSTLGTEETIEAMTGDDIRSFHAHWYRPDRVVVAAAGDLDHDAVVAEVERRCSARPGGSTPPRPPVTEPLESERVLDRDTEQAHLVMGVRTPGALDDDRFALEIVNQSLGGGISSRLFQEVREERGLAYSVYSYGCLFSDTGTLACYAGTTPKHAGEVWDMFSAAFDSLASGGLSEREVAIAKGQTRGSMVLGLEDSAARMHRLGRSQLMLGRVPSIDEQLGRLEAVTADDVDRVVARLAAGPKARAAIGPM